MANTNLKIDNKRTAIVIAAAKRITKVELHSRYAKIEQARFEARTLDGSDAKELRAHIVAELSKCENKTGNNVEATASQWVRVITRLSTFDVAKDWHFTDVLLAEEVGNQLVLREKPAGKSQRRSAKKEIAKLLKHFSKDALMQALKAAE